MTYAVTALVIFILVGFVWLAWCCKTAPLEDDPSEMDNAIAPNTKESQ